MARRRQQANWLAWSLQAALGMVAGIIVGFGTLSEMDKLSWLNAHTLVPFVAGAGLFGAGLASLLGDRLWMGDDYGVLAPDEPEHSPVSRTVSWWLVAAGTATLTVAFLRGLQVL
jgi:hypothetical protein